MNQIETQADVQYLSELYAQDAPDAFLLAEYPSSNSQETTFQNRSKFIIHDPFPPPKRELMKVLGPHHLMCCWGQDVKVSSEIAPSAELVSHWSRTFGESGVPNWKRYDGQENYITLFPHESIPADQQVVNPEVNWALHSKEVIGEIDCPQAKILDSIKPPCVVKLSHGYAGLGNFFVRSTSDEQQMREQVHNHWPTATLVINELIENITGDFGVQFYLRKDGTTVWMGFTEQHFDNNSRWCGGAFSASLQHQMLNEFGPFIHSVGRYLHQQGYFGVVGIDLLRNSSNEFYLVDVNPRLTGISPFLMASRIFAGDGYPVGIYQASQTFEGSLSELIAAAENVADSRVLVLSAFEDQQSGVTVCHLSASSSSIDQSQISLQKLCK